ncbi:hypothetical protein NHX12_002672, partial [Muraenolepis orangiensis]
MPAWLPSAPPADSRSVHKELHFAQSPKASAARRPSGLAGKLANKLTRTQSKAHTNATHYRSEIN